MTTPLLNDLLDEAAQQCADLAAKASAAATAAGEIVEQAQAIGLDAVNAAERLHREYAEAIAAVAHASTQTGDAGTVAGEHVHAVPPKALEAVTAVKDMLVAVEGDAIQFGQDRARRFQELDQTARTTEEAFHDLVTQMQAFDERLSGRLNETHDQLQHFQDLVHGAGIDLAKAGQHLTEEIELLGNVAAKLAEATAHGLEQLLTAISWDSNNYCNDAIRGHNDVMAAVRQAYLDETKADPEPQHTYVETALGKVSEAMHHFGALEEPARLAVQTNVDAFVAEGEKTMTSLTEASENLERAHSTVPT